MKIHKLILTALLTSALYTGTYAQTATVSKGSYTFKINKADNTATITKADKLLAGNVAVAGEVEYEGETYTVTSIGDEAFKNSSQVSIITLPESVTTIGTAAFANCTQLSTINLPNNLTTINANAFSGCKLLATINLPSSLKEIGKYTFKDCATLSTLTIPDGVTTIPDGLLYNCKGITELIISPYTTSIGMSAFNQCKMTSLELPGTIVTIGDSAFRACTKVTSLRIGENVVSMGKTVFFGCTNLKTVHVEAGDATIGADAFKAIVPFETVIYVPDNRYEYYTTQKGWSTYADNIKPASQSGKTFTFNNLDYLITDETAKTVKLVGYKIATGTYNIPQKVEYNSTPYTVTAIGPYAFANNLGLVAVIIPESITTIAPSAFAGCTTMKSITIPNSIVSISPKVFEGCSSLESLTIPSGITFIANNLASGCTNLAELSLPSTITTINDNAFYGCAALKSLTIPQNVTTIGNNAFAGCATIEEVEISANVASIGNNAFNGCAKMDTVVVLGQSTIIGTGVFDGLDENFDILVVPARLKAYRSAQNWSAYADHIKAIGEDNKAIIIDDIYYEITDYVNNEVKIIGFENVGTELVIPDVITIDETEYKVTFIDDNAFEGASDLIRIVVPETIVTISNTAFKGINDEAKIHVYEVKYEAYIADPAWKDYLDKLVVIASINEFTVDGITYGVTGADKKQVFIKSFDNSAESLALVTTIQYQDKTYTLTSIADNAFENCTKLTSITFTTLIQSIGKEAFAGCMGLKKITMPEAITEIADGTFKDCSALDTIALHNKITKIGEYAFANCTKLTKVVLPESVADLGAGAFSGCTKLKTINIPNAITKINDYTFNRCYVLDSARISDKITYIGKSAFASCKWLVAIDLSKNITYIGESAFAGCMQLKLIVLYSENAELGANGFSQIADHFIIYVPADRLEYYKTAENWKTYANYMKPLRSDGKSFILNGLFYRITDFDNNLVQVFTYESIGTKIAISDKVTFNDQEYTVTSIAAHCFEGCTIVKNITLPETIDFIGEAAFANCTKLTTINLPEKLKAIAPETFSGCTLLSSADIPANVTQIGDYAFANCDALRTSILPEGLKKINKGIYSGCHHLQGIIIPPNVDTIEAFAFSDIVANASIKLPTTMKYIGESAFENNKGLVEVEVSANIDSISHNAFNGCWILERVIVRGNDTKIGENVFDACDIVSIYVPVEMLNKYKTAQNWSNYAKFIKPLYLATVTTGYGCYTDLKNNMLLSNTLTFTTDNYLTLSVFVNGEDLSENLVEDNHKYTLVLDNLEDVKTVEDITLMDYKNGAYDIATLDQLIWFMEHISRPENKNANARLVNDIVVNSELAERMKINKLGEVSQWYPNHYNGIYRTINRNSVYNGTFNGNGHTISGIYINDETLENAGLFQTLTGTVENLAITDSYIKAKTNAGILCGTSSGTINNCYIQGVVEGAENNGGIAGSITGNALKNCVFEGKVSGGNAGTIAGSNKATISSVITYGTVAESSTAGTICGYNNGTIENRRYFTEVTKYQAIATNDASSSVSLTSPVSYLEGASEAFSANFDSSIWTYGKTESNFSMAELTMPYLTTFADYTKKTIIIDTKVDGFTKNYFTGNELEKNGYLVMSYGVNEKDTFLISSPDVIIETPNMTVAGKTTVKGRIFDFNFTYNIELIRNPLPVESVDLNGIKIWGYGSKLYIENGENKRANIYTISGALVKSQTITSPHTELHLKPGIYIVKVGSNTVKISL